jgi:hypothetical protein
VTDPSEQIFIGAHWVSRDENGLYGFGPVRLPVPSQASSAVDDAR